MTLSVFYALLLVQSPLLTSTSSSSLPSSPVNLPASFRWLLPPNVDESSVILSTSTNTSSTNKSPQLIHRSQLTPSSLSSPQESNIETVANTLFQDIQDDMYNDAEFLQFLKEWQEENKENNIKNQPNCQID